MVCENEGADWLEFEKLKQITGQRKKSVEVVCYFNNEEINNARQSENTR
jgi:hypothetical protein